MYAGVEFGAAADGGDDVDSPWAPERVTALASSTTGGTIEVRLDSLDGPKGAEVVVENTGDVNTYASVSADVAPIVGQHDVFLRFAGASPTDPLFRLQSIQFAPRIVTTATDGASSPTLSLAQNRPNPVRAAAAIEFSLATPGHVTLSVVNVLGQEVATLVDGVRPAGPHAVTVDASQLASGLYLYRLVTDSGTVSRTMTVVR